MGDQRVVGPQPAQHRLSGILFSIYSAEEVARVSVVEVTEKASFDDLGHVQHCGLYDPRMGPSDPDDPPCSTCTLPFNNCPGHPGHISLPLPAFHPLLYFTTLHLLRGSCLFCHKLMCTSNALAVRAFLVKLRLIDAGRLTDVDRVQELMERAAGSETAVGVTESEAQLDEFLSSRLAESVEEKDQLNRHRVEARAHLVGAFCRNHLFKVKAKCPHCTSRQPKYRNENCRTIVLDFSGAKKGGKKDAEIERELFLEEGQDELDQLDLDTKKEQSEESKQAAEIAMLKYLKDHETNMGIDAQLRAAATDMCPQLVWTAQEVREQLRMVWAQEQESALLGTIYPIFLESQLPVKDETEPVQVSGVDKLFVSKLMVPANRFRPVRFMGGDKFDHPQTGNLKRVIEEIELVKAILQLLGGTKSESLEDFIAGKLRGPKENVLRLRTAYSQLQDRLNLLYDQDLNKLEKNRIPGMRQVLEKKAGLFRMNMMGKRVNYCARTVITPDPFLAVDEIGIPSVFSKKLTFAEPVNDLNLPHLKHLVAAGPNAVHGANFVAFPGQSRLVRLNPDDTASRNGAANRLYPPDPNITTPNDFKPPAKVLRHLVNGDIMMMNRQPTLHKPSIMGHRARVLTKQKAFRMNYAPCKAYNADFDGDEMNGHFVQDYLSRAEAYEIGAVSRNYLVPKDGTPILGLIQDHVISGSLLSLRGSLFGKADYQALVLSAFPVITKRLHLLRPAHLKPGPFWTGKQIISTVILNVLPDHCPPLNLDSKAKTADSNWRVEDTAMAIIGILSESKVIIRGGELVQGIFDKAHFGATQYGLIHCVMELYGPTAGAALLSSFSRLFTTYLRIHGFSLGVRDILVKPEPDRRRRKTIRRLRDSGMQVVMDAFNLQADGGTWDDANLRQLLEFKYTTKSDDVKQLDFNMKLATDKFNAKINDIVIPHGLIAAFPDNGLQLMIQAGAKGTMVNAMQISCMVGQIELEGQRPPLSASGRTLPSFKSYDVSPRAGGFVDGRFLTGIPPQELFFHTMAGREGLIDTAVKTSRSGYLQRCIIKHLEGMTVHYDHSVRDSDRSIIQFDYGEDGMDVGKVKFLKSAQLPFLCDNAEAALASVVPRMLKDGELIPQLNLAKIQPPNIALKLRAKVERSIAKAKKRYGSRQSGFLTFCEEEGLDGNVSWQAGQSRRAYEGCIQEWRECEAGRRSDLEKKYGKKARDPLTSSIQRTTHLAALPEPMLQELSPDNLKKTLPNATPEQIEKLFEAFYWKAIRGFADPGDNVGLLASQSIGEPSTQMTLNTFHFAGRGEMNVTLGIPRLREILMVASKTIKTPTSQVPFKEGVSDAKEEKLKQHLDRVMLKDVLKATKVTEASSLSPDEEFWYDTVRIDVKTPAERGSDAPSIPNDLVLLALEKAFYKRLGTALQKRQDEATCLADLSHKAMKYYADEVMGETGGGGGGAEEEESGDEGGAEDGVAAERIKARGDDAGEYEGEEEEEKVVAPKEMDEDLTDEEEETAEAAEKEDEADVKAGAAAVKTMDAQRIAAVLRTHRLIHSYSYEPKHGRWAECVFKITIPKGRLDLKAIFEREAVNFVVKTVPGIEKCFLPKGEHLLRTAGVNLQELFRHGAVLDLDRVATNDIHIMAATYGIEAASRVLVMEVKNVFGGYGIEVDARHLSLVADYLTYSGSYRAFNRMAMESAASPLQKMTYESTTKFMRDAILHGYKDYGQSPSARLIMGETVGGGTGCIDLRLPLSRIFKKNPPIVPYSQVAAQTS